MLLTDGYAAYERYAERTGITHARCWAHTRRNLERAKDIEPAAVASIQSLVVTCRLHEIDPYDYLVDVLQRSDRHPAAEVELLTPRLWKQHFAGNPLRSDLHSLLG